MFNDKQDRLLRCVLATCLMGLPCCGSVTDERSRELQQGITFDAIIFPSHALPLQIKRLGTNVCFDVPGASNVAGVALQQFSCHSQRNQDYFLVYNSDSQTYQIRTGSNKCLSGEGTSVVQRECQGGMFNQRWRIESDFVSWRIQNYETGTFITAANANSGTPLSLAGGNQFTWEITADEYDRNVLMPLHSAHNYRCIDVQGASLNNHALVQQFTCSGANHQRWQFLRTSTPGRWKIKSKNSGKCLDLPGGNTNNGVQIQQFTCQSGNANQEWFVTEGFERDTVEIKRASSATNASTFLGRAKATMPSCSNLTALAAAINDSKSAVIQSVGCSWFALQSTTPIVFAVAPRRQGAYGVTFRTHAWLV